MKRRQFIRLAGGASAAVLGGRVSHAQPAQPMRRIGTLIGGVLNDPERQRRIDALKQGLHALGWIEGRNFRFEEEIGQRPPVASPWEASALVNGSPDLIITSSGLGVRELNQVTSTIPILFINVADPVGGGLISSLSSSGNNVTGFTAFEYRTAGKGWELLKEIAPNTKIVALVFGGP